MKPQLYSLENISIESSVSAFDGKPYCQIRARSAEGHLMSGQLPPETCKSMARGS